VPTYTCSDTTAPDVFGFEQHEVHELPPEILMVLNWHELREDELGEVIRRIPRCMDFFGIGDLGDDFYEVTLHMCEPDMCSYRRMPPSGDVWDSCFS
jgi:hypothetical protein